MSTFDHRSVVAVAPGVPEGSIFAGFENNEQVQLYNGNLLVAHPSAVTYPLDSAGSLGLSRVYNSMNVIDRQVTPTALLPGEKRSIITGKTWVGFGWRMHLGRIVMESVERNGIAGFNPGCTDDEAGGYDPCYHQSEYFFEAPDGTKTRFAATDPDGGITLSGNRDPLADIEARRNLKSGQEHPILRVRYFKAPGDQCHLSGGRPVWCDGRVGALPAECTHFGDNCLVSSDGEAHYLVELEDGTELRLEKQVEVDRGTHKFIRNASNQGWYPTRIRYPGKNSTGDTILDITYHRQACEASGTNGCDQIYPYGEALKEITSPTHPEIHIWTEVWTTNDYSAPGYSAQTQGMLRAIHSTGPSGQTVTYRYFYDWAYDELDNGLEAVARLIKVEIPSAGAAAPMTVQYTYRDGFDATLEVPGTGFLLDTITYPLGGQSRYIYSEWACGAKKQCNPRSEACNEIGVWNMNPRVCRGVVERHLKPEGATGPVATSYWARAWTASRCGEEAIDDEGVRNRYAFITASRVHSTSELVLDPCREAVTPPPNIVMSGRFGVERTFDGEGETTALRTRVFDYSMENGASAPHASPNVGTSRPPVFARAVTTTYHDDTGACFGVGAGGSTAKQSTTRYALRDDWNNWRLRSESSDYSSQTASGPVKRIAFVDYRSPLTTPIRFLDRHEVGPYSRAFVEDGSGTANQAGNESGRYEVSYKFEGDDLGDAGLGRVKEIVAKDDWLAASTRLDTDPPQIAGNVAGDATDLKAEIGFDDRGNVTSAAFSGGNADPVTGQRKSYALTYHWTQGMADSLRIAGLPYDTSHIVPDRGAVGAVIDPNGLQTGFTFDSLGRVTQIDPPGNNEQSTRIIYPSTNAQELRQMRVIHSAGTETSFDALNGDQLYSGLEFDGLGRTITRTKAVPGAPDGSGKLAQQVVRYDMVGREVFVSEWMTSEEYAAATKTSWYEPNWDRNGDGTADNARYYVTDIPMRDGRPWGTTTFYGVPLAADPANPLKATPDGLGRVRRVVAADGSITDTENCGPHEQVTVRSVRTGIPGASGGTSQEYSDVTTRYYKDDAGQLVFVDTEPLATGFRADNTTNGQTVVRYDNAASPGADAAYRYDPRGNLTQVTLYPSNVVTGDPFAAWRAGTLPSGGQQRQFHFNAVGRLIDSFQPEKGWEKNRLYDAWGNLLGWQDQLGIDRNYWLRNTYDVAGRPLLAEKRSGSFPNRSPGAPVSESVSGTGAHTVAAESFEGGFSGWEEGSIAAGSFSTGATLWNPTSHSTLPCIGAPPGTTGTGLYFGNGCSYSAAPASEQAARRTLSGVTHDDTLSFKYYRSTRENTNLGSGSLDQLAVWAVLDGTGTADDNSVTGKRILFAKSEAQAVYSRWFKSPAIRIGDYFTPEEWPEGASETVRLYIVFTKGDSAQSGLGSGVMIDDLFVGRQDVETLSEQTWDEAHCSLGTGGSACDHAVESQDRSNAQLTSVRSYQDGDLLALKRYVFRGLNGRLSGLRSQIDWTGGAALADPQTWSDFVYGMTYSPRGIVDDLFTPVLAVATETRTYHSSFQRDLLTQLRHTEAGLDFFAGTSNGISYDSAGLPVGIAFANDTTQQILRDAMHRPSSITSTWVGDPVPIFSTGTYRFDGAGNIGSIGDGTTTQSFMYDASSRLTKAWMLPRATDRSAVALHKIDYAFDPFGNILSQQMLTEGPVPPAGFNFTLEYGSATESNGQSVTNRIKSPGFSHDANGNLLRFRGQYQQPVGAVWDPRNRMREFIPSDPTLGQDAPVETYAYDASGYRIVKIDHTGRPMISIRNEQGSALSEFLVEQGATQPTLSRDFLYANGSLLIERAVSPTEPTMAVHSTFQSGSAYQFKLTSGTGHDAYSVDIATASGWRRSVGGIEPDAQGVFSIPEAELSPGETNFVRVRIESPVASGYSAPVSVSYDPNVTSGSANQIRALSISRNGTDIVLRWKLNQSNGKQTRLYFKRADTQATYLLTPMALSSSVVEFTLNSQALASPCGSFWGTQIQAMVESGPSPSAGLGSNRPGEQGAPDGCGAPPAPSPLPSLRFVNSYRHLDHLGSLRVARGDSGAIEAGVSSEVDLYPYGSEFADVEATSTRRFTGHERDDGVGLDYMLARYYSAAQARLLAADPSTTADRQVSSAQRWNKFSYVLNSPTNLIDPNGEDPFLCARPVTGPPPGNHMFVVTGAEKVGDKSAGTTIFSFGDAGDDTVGLVTGETEGMSNTTSATDTAAWAGAAGSDSNTVCVPIPASDAQVTLQATSVMPGVPYSLSPRVVPDAQGPAANSNAAAQAVANEAAGQVVPGPDVWTPGALEWRLIGFDTNKDGAKDQSKVATPPTAALPSSERPLDKR